MVSASYLLSPMATIAAIIDAFRRMASSISTPTHSSLSSVSTVEPAEQRNAIGLSHVGGIIVRRMPRVHIKQSAYSISGTIERSIRSRPAVGPMM